MGATLGTPSYEDADAARDGPASFSHGVGRSGTTLFGADAMFPKALAVCLLLGAIPLVTVGQETQDADGGSAIAY